jgi:hypothetical protein
MSAFGSKADIIQGKTVIGLSEIEMSAKGQEQTWSSQMPSQSTLRCFDFGSDRLAFFPAE